MRGERSLLFGSVVVLVAAVQFGTLGVVTHFAYAAGLTPDAVAGWRALLGALGLAIGVVVTAVPRGRPILPSGVGRRELAMLGLAAILGALVNIGFFGAFARMPVALVSLAFYTYPVMIGIVGALFLGEPLDRVRIGSLVLAVCGTTLAVLGGSGARSLAGGLVVDPLGLALALGAAASQVGLSLVMGRGFRSIPSAHATIGILGGMAVIFWAGALLTGRVSEMALPLRSPEAFALVAWMGLITAACSTFLFVIGVRLIGPLLAGILSLFDPVVAIVLAAVVLDERLAPIGLVGAGLVIAAVVVVQRVPTRLLATGTDEPSATAG